MNSYLIYKDNTSQPKAPRIEIIKEGSSLWAALFNVIWALYHRLWILLGATFIYGILVWCLYHYGASGSFCGLLYLFILPYYSIYAVFWRGLALEQRGFVLTEVVIAHNYDGALLKALRKNFEN